MENSDEPIKYPGQHDFLLGRGGETNNHSGNILFRQLIRDYREAYQNAPKTQKPLISQKLVAKWRSMNPPGRFLERNEPEKVWRDVGDPVACRKTSKALGERGKRNKQGGPNGTSSDSPVPSSFQDTSGAKRKREDIPNIEHQPTPSLKTAPVDASTTGRSHVGISAVLQSLGIASQTPPPPSTQHGTTVGGINIALLLQQHQQHQTRQAAVAVAPLASSNASAVEQGRRSQPNNNALFAAVAAAQQPSHNAILAAAVAAQQQQQHQQVNSSVLATLLAAQQTQTQAPTQSPSSALADAIARALARPAPAQAPSPAPATAASLAASLFGGNNSGLASIGQNASTTTNAAIDAALVRSILNATIAGSNSATATANTSTASNTNHILQTLAGKPSAVSGLSLSSNPPSTATTAASRSAFSDVLNSWHETETVDENHYEASAERPARLGQLLMDTILTQPKSSNSAPPPPPAALTGQPLPSLQQTLEQLVAAGVSSTSLGNNLSILQLLASRQPQQVNSASPSTSSAPAPAASRPMPSGDSGMASALAAALGRMDENLVQQRQQCLRHQHQFNSPGKQM